MTEESSTKKTRIAEFTERCREIGLKITPQRLEIFREMIAATDHPSALMLHKRLQQRMPTISLDTVYRTLLTFEQHNLIARVNTRESLARFDALMEPHHHLICELCHGIEDIQSKSLDELQLADRVSDWGEIQKIDVVMYGVCKKCLGKKVAV
jgi:Fur family peroxide stress response transcriptional regulator